MAATKGRRCGPTAATGAAPLRQAATIRGMDIAGSFVLLLACVGLGIVPLVVLIWGVTAYNRLIRRRNQVDASWAQIDVQLTRRHDLIPNLVETVKGYAAHERATLEAVIAARNGAVAAQSQGAAGSAEAETHLTRALERLFALSEAYPDLKANQNFVALQSELANTEDKIAYARQFFNSAVQTYNTTVQTLPTNLIASLGGFRMREYFEAAGGVTQGPLDVRF
jgi:LemA protein